MISFNIVIYSLQLCNLVGRASFTAILTGFSDCMIISPTCNRVPSSNSINKAKTGTEVLSLPGVHGKSTDLIGSNDIDLALIKG